MNGYQVHDAWLKHAQRQRDLNGPARTAATLDQVVLWLDERFPELAECPDAILAVLHCRERGLPASMVPVVRDQLVERRAA